MAKTKRSWDKFDEEAANEGAAIVESNTNRVQRPAGRRSWRERQARTRGDKLQQSRVERRHMGRAA
jgi:hypothetical protein